LSFGKPNSEKSVDELSDDVDKKKALPDLVHKRNIIDAFKEMSASESIMMFNYLKNGRNFNDLDAYRYRSCVLMVFNMIMGMIPEAGCLSLKIGGNPLFLVKNNVKNEYELAIRMKDYAELDIKTIIYINKYLHYCLTEMNLTNLLINNVSVDDEDLTHM
jgi:hypothetical protein